MQTGEEEKYVFMRSHTWSERRWALDAVQWCDSGCWKWTWRPWGSWGIYGTIHNEPAECEIWQSSFLRTPPGNWSICGGDKRQVKGHGSTELDPSLQGVEPHLYPTRRVKCKHVSSKCVWSSSWSTEQPHSGQTWGLQLRWMRWWAAALQLLDRSIGGEHSVQVWRGGRVWGLLERLLHLHCFYDNNNNNNEQQKVKKKKKECKNKKKLTVICAGLTSWKCSVNSFFPLNAARHSGHLLLTCWIPSDFLLVTAFCCWDTESGMTWPEDGKDRPIGVVGNRLVKNKEVKQRAHIKNIRFWIEKKKEASLTGGCGFQLADHLLHGNGLHH